MVSLRFFAKSHSLGLVLLGGFFLRLFTLPVGGGIPWDTAVFRDWGVTLANYPMGDFYGPESSALSPDHLPGDIILYKVLQVFYSSLGGNDFGILFEYCSKAVAVGFDFLLVWAVWRLLVNLGVRRNPTLVAAVILFNPLTWIISSWWGQWDSVNCTLIVAALALAMRPKLNFYHLSIVCILLTWAMLIKPPLLLLAAPIVVWTSWRLMDEKFSISKMFTAFAVAVLSSAGTISAILIPFDLSLWGEKSLLSVARGIVALHTNLPISSPVNLWWFLDGNTTAASEPRLGSLTGVEMSNIIVALGLIMVSSIFLWRRSRIKETGSNRFIVYLLMLYFSYYSLSLVMHERYIFPVIILFGIWALIENRKSIWLVYWIASTAAAAAAFGVATRVCSIQRGCSVELGNAMVPLISVAALLLIACYIFVILRGLSVSPLIENETKARDKKELM